MSLNVEDAESYVDISNSTNDTSDPIARPVSKVQVDRSILSLTGETLIVRIIVLGVSFLSNIIVSRQLGPEGRGVLALIMFWSGLIATIFIFGLDSLIIYLTGLSKGRFHRLFVLSLVYVAIVSIFLGMILLRILRIWVLSNASEEMRWFLIIITVITMMQILLNALFIGLNKISLVNISSLMGTCLYLLLLIFLYIENRVDLKLVSWANISAQIMPVITLCYFSRKVNSAEFLPIVIPDSLYYAFKAYLGNIANVLLVRVNFLVLSLLVPVAELGVFSIAQMFADLILFLPNTMMNVLLPRIIGLPEQEIIQKMSQIIRCTLLVAFIVSLSIGVFATIAIPVIFGKDFALAVPIVWLLTLSSWFGSIGMMLSIYFNAVGRPEVPASTAWLGFVTTSILTAGFATFLGGIGAAMALCLARLITSLWMLMMYWRSTRTSWMTVLIIQASDWKFGSEKMRAWYANATRL